ncbi:MAG: hypothetical protein GQ564_00445 [Bacteroidales bacterium]|nr:hypothetical protein [Bacteroidales bacterium]
MRNFQNTFINPQNISKDISKRLCFLNNKRSKYFTVLLIICSSSIAFYDIIIVQNLIDYKIFIIHFKTDIIFLVFSFIFTLYIFFNQVKTDKKIRNHHKFIHGSISIFILTWSFFKSIILIKYGNGNFNIAIIALLITSFLYLFNLQVYLSQLILTFIFTFITLLLFNLKISDFIEDFIILLTISCFSMIISQYVYYLQHKILLLESEVATYKKD